MTTPTSTRAAGTRQWLLNVAAGYVDLAVGAAIFILITPIIVRHLGVEGYAVWMLSHTITFYLGFFNLGLGEAQVRLHARFGELRRGELLQRLFGTVLVALAIAGMLACATGMAVAFGPLPEWFDVSRSLAGDLRTVLAILAVNLLISMPASTLRNFYEGAQRFDIQHVQAILMRLATASTQVYLLSAGYGVVELAAVELAATCVGVAIDLILIRRLMPGIFSVPVSFHRRTWQRIRTFACWASIDDLVAEGSSKLDEILIALLLPLALLTPYGLCLALGGVLMVAVRPLTETFFPMAAALHAARRPGDLTRMLLFGTKLTTALAAPLAVFLAFFGDSVVRVWVPQVAEQTSGMLAPIIVVSSLFSVFLWTSSVLLLAINRVRLLVLLTVIEVAIEIALILVLAPRMGLEGVAIAGLVANVGVGLVLELPAVSRIVGIPVITLLWSGLLRLAAASAPALLVAATLRHLHPQAGLPFLIGAAAITGIICVCGLAVFGAGNAERREIVLMWKTMRSGQPA